MSTTTLNTLKTTSAMLLKVALLVAAVGGLSAALPANLTRINPTLSVVQVGDAAGQV